MQYLDAERLDAIEAKTFQCTEPYPWVNLAGLLNEAGYRQLLATLPAVEQFHASFGMQRSHGQRPHDRYALEYRSDLDIDPAWHDFVAELQSDRYRRFIRRMFGRGRFKLNFHWHYAPRGASVSPHCDASRKLGSHIFYFNEPGSWDPAWGGGTAILDDNGRFPRKSAPAFEDFDRIHVSDSVGNYSLLFQSRERSWHGMRELACPEGYLRKVFIVVINDRLRAAVRRTKARLRGEEIRDY